MITLRGERPDRRAATAPVPDPVLQHRGVPSGSFDRIDELLRAADAAMYAAKHHGLTAGRVERFTAPE